VGIKLDLLTGAAAISAAMRILLTGSAGFIGYHLARRLLSDGHIVHGVDNLVPYYDVTLKRRRHELLAAFPQFSVHLVDVADRAALAEAMRQSAPEVVLHLAAQAGVRYAITHPDVYVQSNFVGSFNLLDLCREHRPAHVMIASTSSAYGTSTRMPFTEDDPADTPLTIYAATKRGSEMVGHCYAHLWDLPVTVFRFFTVYGPWGRPDMALFKFTDRILNGAPIDVHNGGRMERDFTYVDDLVEAIVRLMDVVPRRGETVAEADSLSPAAPYRVVNIGNGNPVKLDDFIAEIERCTGRQAIRNNLPMQPGEVVKTWADAGLLQQLIGYRPATPISVGVPAFVDWYRSYYGT
jgi:UDP-glucuronate 4-epimerase